MDFIRKLFEQYAYFVSSALREPGWIPSAVIFAVSFVDAVVPIPGGMDAFVATAIFAVGSNKLLVVFYVLLAAAGNTAGNIILYAVGYTGGEVFLEKRLGKRKFEEMHRKFEKREVLTLALAAMMPPPFPFKAVVFSAAVFEVNLPRFLFGIFIGRLTRFTILTILVLIFGPQVVQLFGRAFREHLWLSLAIAAGILVVAVLVWRWRRRRWRP